jgi:hypothetical protein
MGVKLGPGNKERTYVESVWEQSAEENVCTLEGGKKTA